MAIWCLSRPWWRSFYSPTATCCTRRFQILNGYSCLLSFSCFFFLSWFLHSFCHRFYSFSLHSCQRSTAELTLNWLICAVSRLLVGTQWRVLRFLQILTRNSVPSPCYIDHITTTTVQECKILIPWRSLHCIHRKTVSSKILPTTLAKKFQCQSCPVDRTMLNLLCRSLLRCGHIVSLFPLCQPFLLQMQFV